MAPPLARLVLMLLGGLALVGCRAVRCEPRVFTPTGDVTVDLLGSWDFSAEGWAATTDKWAFTFRPDGGVTIVHAPYQSPGATAYNPLGGTQRYAVEDGGYTLLEATPPLFVPAVFVPGAMVEPPPLPTLAPQPRAALTCEGAG